jgi:choline dehydrogenase-like flavoprotein
MTEQVDVVIAGSGFGGSITAFRLAELYRAAGTDPRSIVVLERGRRFRHVDFKQSMHVDHLSSVYNLIQGQGCQVVTANAVGGGSNLYLAASLRSPSETFERRDRGPGDGPERRMWPDPISRATLNPYYERAERGLRVNAPDRGTRCPKSGGLWAATLAAAGHTCDRVPLASARALREREVVPHRLHLRRQELADHQLPRQRRALGVQVRPASRSVGAPVQRAAVPLRRHRAVIDRDPPAERLASRSSARCSCCRPARWATPPILMRSRNDLPALSDHVGKHLGVNGDHVAAIEYDPQKVRDVLGSRATASSTRASRSPR